MELAYVKKVIIAITTTMPIFLVLGQLCGFMGSLGPSQSTMFDSADSPPDSDWFRDWDLSSPPLWRFNPFSRSAAFVDIACLFSGECGRDVEWLDSDAPSSRLGSTIVDPSYSSVSIDDCDKSGPRVRTIAGRHWNDEVR